MYKTSSNYDFLEAYSLYAFEGNFRKRPEQNLSGASKKHTRDALLQKAHEERQKRQVIGIISINILLLNDSLRSIQDMRQKQRSAECLQSHIRSYLARKQKKCEERYFYDKNEQQLTIRNLLSRLLFFYDSDLDKERFVSTQHKCRQSYYK